LIMLTPINIKLFVRLMDMITMEQGKFALVLAYG